MEHSAPEAGFDRLLAGLDPAGPPQGLVLAGDCPPQLRLAAMAGSFNPPTRAHLALARAAIATDTFDRLLFLLSVHTIDKEEIVGATLVERCRMLAALLLEEDRFAAVATNRGLYLDQAIALHAAFAPVDLAFVVGFDKIVQILDPRYYADREAALAQLFARARFLVAPRDGAGAAELAALFRRTENRPYAARVRLLPVTAPDPQDLTLSSTRVRALLARGEDVRPYVPAAVLPVLATIRGYRPPGREMRRQVGR